MSRALMAFWAKIERRAASFFSDTVTSLSSASSVRTRSLQRRTAPSGDRLPPPLRLGQHRLEDGVQEYLGVLGEGDAHPDIVADLARLPVQHLEHDLVHRVVLPVQEAGLDLGPRLPEAVHAAFALLEAVRVPGEVVVEDRVEEALEVDALGKAVGGHENAELAPCRFGAMASILVAAHVVGVLARHALDEGVFPQGAGDLFGDVLGCLRCSGRRRSD